MKLEAQRTALENAGHHIEVMKVLEYTNKVLKNANKNLDIDKVSCVGHICSSKKIKNDYSKFG